MIKRCEWADSNPLYVAYHDKEWGVPVHNDRKIFEFLILEGAQAGLSWLTVLKKRQNYKKAFDNFNAEKIARYDRKKVNELLQNPGIIRNRLKIAAAITNARAFLEAKEECGGFNKFIWRFVGGKPIINKRKKMGDIPATTPESDAMSRELKRRGFKFVGSTICYAHMQATGMVNDHTVDCFRYKELKG
ncbi:MAG: DNA-3-methyladenine glycosylase I [Nitrospinota bacterium]